jgi:hypothetical protein
MHTPMLSLFVYAHVGHGSLFLVLADGGKGFRRSVVTRVVFVYSWVVQEPTPARFFDDHLFDVFVCVFVCCYASCIFFYLLQFYLWIFRYYWSVLWLVLSESAFSSL